MNIYKRYFKILKLQNISEENINNILRNVHIEKTTEDMAISMGKILDKISENGGKVSASCLDGKSLKELKVLKKSLDEFYLNGKTVLEDENIRDIKSLYKVVERKDFNLMTKEEKTNYLSKIYSKYESQLINLMTIEPPEKKMEIINKYLDEEVFDEEAYLKKQETQKALNIFRELDLLNSGREKQEKFRLEKEKENSILKSNGQEPIYNKQLDKVYEDNKLSRDKQDFLKYAYFKKGIDIEEFKKNMGNEIYNCSEEQLENYVELWDKYQRNYISRDDFYYGKNVVFKEEISQESIEEIIIPMLQEDTLSKKEIDECINSSIDEGDEFFKEVTNLAVAAEEHNYPEAEIIELIKDAADEPIDKIHEEVELIQEKSDNELDVDVLDNLKTDEIKIIRDYDLEYADKNFEL